MIKVTLNDQASCDAWLASEQTRTYRDATWSTQIDVTQEPSTVGG